MRFVEEESKDCVQFFYRAVVDIIDEDVHEQVEMDKACQASVSIVPGRNGEEVSDSWFYSTKNV